jgi:hypothetical protein
VISLLLLLVHPLHPGHQAAKSIYPWSSSDDVMAASTTTEMLFEKLDDANCQWDGCEGTLGRATFKGDDALVCQTCGTPAVRVW